MCKDKNKLSKKLKQIKKKREKVKHAKDLLHNKCRNIQTGSSRIIFFCRIKN